MLGEIYAIVAQYDPEFIERAESVLQDAIVLSPNRPSLYRALGRFYAQEGRAQEAIVLFERAVELNNTIAQSHWELGVALIEAGFLEEGEKEQQRASELSGFENQN